MGLSLYGCVAATREAPHPLAWLWTISLGWQVLALPSSGASAGLLLIIRYVCFFVLFKGWLWVGAWKFLGVWVPLPPCSWAHRSPSRVLGGQGLVVATHRVVMVALQFGSCAQGCHGYPMHSAIVLPYLSRHLPQAHLLLMSLKVPLSNNLQNVLH